MVLHRNELDVLKPIGVTERTALVQARSGMTAIREYALAGTTLAVKLRLSVQNTIDRKSGILDEKPPEVVAQRSSLLSGCVSARLLHRRHRRAASALRPRASAHARRPSAPADALRR